MYLSVRLNCGTEWKTRNSNSDNKMRAAEEERCHAESRNPGRRDWLVQVKTRQQDNTHNTKCSNLKCREHEHLFFGTIYLFI
jgi:hypothetical protein